MKEHLISISIEDGELYVEHDLDFVSVLGILEWAKMLECEAVKISNAMEAYTDEEL